MPYALYYINPRTLSIDIKSFFQNYESATKNLRIETMEFLKNNKTVSAVEYINKKSEILKKNDGYYLKISNKYPNRINVYEKTSKDIGMIFSNISCDIRRIYIFSLIEININNINNINNGNNISNVDNINNIDNESLKNTLKKIEEIKNTIKTVTEKSSKKAEQETFAELVLEFFSNEGFDVEVDSLDEEIFSITATSKERTLKVLIDEDMNVMADFSEGYVNLYNGKCEEDTNEFIETLKKMGCKVKVKNYERKQPTKRDGAEENMYGQKYREARRNS